MADRYWVGGAGNLDGSTTTHISATSGGVGGASYPTSSDNLIFDANSNATAFTVTVTGATSVANLIIGNPLVGVITFAGSSALNVYGNLDLPSGGTWTYSGTITMKATSTGMTITSRSVQLQGPVTLDGVGGGWTLVDTFKITGGNGTLTLTNGSFDSGNQAIQLKRFSSNNSNTRVITMGSSTWTLTANSATLWDTGTVTGLTLNAGTSIIDCTYSGSTGSRVIATSTARINTLKFSAGTDTVDLASCMMNDLNYTGFGGIQNGNNFTVGGSLTCGASMTFNTGGNLTMDTTGSKTITSNGVQIKKNILITGVGGTITLADALSLDSTHVLTLTNGTFDGAGFAFTGNVASNNSNTRTFTMGNGLFTLTGTGTVWDFGTTTNLTFNIGSSTIKITNTTNTALTFAGGGLNYSTSVWFSRSTSTAANTITGSNTFAILKDDGTGTHSLLFTAGTTTTISTAAGWQVNGTAGHLITVDSVTAATHSIVCTSGAISADYLSINNSVATGGANFYAGANSTNVSGNVGWQFMARGTPANYEAFALLT